MGRKKFSLIGDIADFDYHGAWGDFNSPKPLKAWLDTLAADDEGEIEINSPGGLVVQGIEMANAIKNCKAKIVAHVTGIAASMASVIACACDEIEMEEASFMMIHDPWGLAIGNADEMRKEASVLDQMKKVCMAFYRSKFNRTEEEIAKLMTGETWYTGQECVDNGLKCTVIKSEMRAAASISGRHFDNMPEAAAKFLTSKVLTEEGKAEIAKAKAEAEKADAAGAEGAGDNPNSRPNNENGESIADAAGGAQGSVVAPQPAQTAAAAEGDWEARYKGASKKINELNGKIAELVKGSEEGSAAFKAMEDRAKAAEKSIADDLGKIKGAGYENLDALITAVSGLKSDLEKSGKDLADTRQQLSHMKETRNLLTGGVLTPSDELPTMEEGLANCKTPKEKSAFLASGKYRKTK